MKKLNKKYFLIVPSLLLSAVVFLSGGCTTQSASTTVGEPAAGLPSAEADPDVRGALTVIARTPDSPIGFNQLAAIYIQKARKTGDFSLNSKAETAVNKALEKDPSDLTARNLQASLHLTFHRFNEALAAGTQIQKEAPNNAFIQGVISDANVELGNYGAAVEATQKMVDLKPNTASYARAAQLRTLYGDHAGAIEMMTLAARTADPANKEEQSWCLVQLGDEHWKNGNYERAEAVYDEALQNTPDFHLALSGKGRIRAANGDLESAVKYLADAQNRVPNIDMIIMLGDVYTKLGNAEKAAEQYALAEVIEQKLGDAGDQRKLALLWADQNTKIDEALAIAEREYAVRKDIYTADILAWCLYKKGRFADAKKAVGEAMRLNTKDAKLMYHAGMIEKGLGNKAAAKRSLAAALKLNPAFDLIQAENARAALAELN